MELKVNGKIILIDDNMAYLVHKQNLSLAQNGYVYIWWIENKKIILRLLHRVIMNVHNRTIFVDHINGNRLDNRVENLRLVTDKKNSENRKGANSNSKSGIRGVWQIKDGYWRARVVSHGKRFEKDFLYKKDAVEWVKNKRKELGFLCMEILPEDYKKEKE